MVLWARLSYKMVVRTRGLILWQENFIDSAGNIPPYPIRGQVVPGVSPGEWAPELPASLSMTDLPLVLCLKVSEATNDHCLDPHCHWELQNRDFSNSLISPVFVSWNSSMKNNIFINRFLTMRYSSYRKGKIACFFPPLFTSFRIMSISTYCSFLMLKSPHL